MVVLLDKKPMGFLLPFSHCHGIFLGVHLVFPSANGLPQITKRTDIKYFNRFEELDKTGRETRSQV